MGTMNAFYVRAESGTVAAALRQAFPAATLEAGNGFTAMTLPDEDFEPPMERLAQLSVELKAEVIWLGFQSVVDGFQFHHWQAGALVRSLIYGCNEEERMWEEATGQAEPWEAAAIFDPKALEFAMSFAESERQKQELQRIWQKRELTAGGFEPSLDARETARAAAIFYGLPGWGLPSQPSPPTPALASTPPAGAEPPPLPFGGKVFQVRARLVPRYLWTTSSIDVYLDGRCILKTGGQAKLTGGFAGTFAQDGQEHRVELKWGHAHDHQFPYELWIDGKMIMSSWVLVENKQMMHIPAAMILVTIGGVFAALFYLIAKLKH